MKIYTKTGDTGLTSLIGGTRVKKSHQRIEAYGTVDELNSYLGLIKDYSGNIIDISILKEIQDRLFTIGSVLAADPIKSKMKLPDLKEGDIVLLELEMDKMNEKLPSLTHFILPGGDILASHCHIARCVCRRAERAVVALSAIDEVDSIIIIYLNRLSDYLFTLARYFIFLLNKEEIKWLPRV